MKKLLKIVLVYSLALFFTSCYYNELPEEADIVIPPETEVSFDDDIVPIFISYNCSQCHKSGGQSPDLSAGNEYNSLVPAYVNAGSSSTSKLYTVLAIDRHRNVDKESIALIKKWIDDGAEAN